MFLSSHAFLSGSVPCIGAYCKVQCDNPVSQKCLPKQSGFLRGLAAAAGALIAGLTLTWASASVQEEAAFCLWPGSHSATLFNSHSLPSWKTHVEMNLEADQEHAQLMQ